MIRALLCLAPLALSACAGVATYSVQPFYESNTGKVICCQATARNGKDISSLTFDLSMAPNNTMTVHFSETGVGATAPLTAQGAVISNVATAVGNTAAAIVKIAP
jgi:hypothetical protein